MTSQNDVLQFRVLGPLEVRLEDEQLLLGGAKQRAALALLCLRADQIVSVEELIDEVWGDSAPPSAAHSLESYVSRLRQLIGDTGPRLVRRGAGYTLELAGARFDARAFEDLHDAVARAAAGGDHERVSELAARALGLWRGRALADVVHGASIRAEADRLEELRLRVLEQLADAELAAGRHEALVGELRVLGGLNPYRERFVAQLMLALYRSGRHVEALDVYEQTRTTLAGDLGLRPSAELQQLSGEIVRQEPHLGAPARDAVAFRPSTKAKPSGRRSVLVGAVAAAAIMLTASGSDRQVADAASTRTPVRIALVLPRAADAAESESLIARYEARLRSLAFFDETLSTQTIEADDVGARLSRAQFDLVLWVGEDALARAFAPSIRALRRTRFAFLDASLETLGLRGVPNATAVRFAEEESSELVGYMSGLVDARGSAGPADVISVIAPRETPTVRRVVAGFRRGVARARHGATVFVQHLADADRTRCEQLANAQIDRGSDVVFTVGGHCAAAAAAVARIRDVWAAADGGAVAEYGDHLLVRTYKHHEQAVKTALTAFTTGTLPAGRELVLGLQDNYAVGLSGTNPAVPPAVSSEVVRLCSSLRSHSAAAS